MATAAVKPQPVDIKVSDLPALPDPFEIKTVTGERKYVLQVCNGQPYGLYKIIAAAFDHVSRTEDSPLLGPSGSQGYWKHRGVIESLYVKFGADATTETELIRDERETVVKNFNYIKSTALRLEDRGLSLCIVLLKQA